MSINTLVEFVSQLKKNPFHAVETVCKINGVGYKGELTGAGAKYVLLRNASQNIDLRTEIARHCNGMIVDLEGRKIVSLPPAKLCNKFDLKKVIKSLDKYRAYLAKDGSVVTIYFDAEESSWKISSAQGFDVTNMNWLGESTFGQALAECLAAVPGFSFGALDKNRCYSVGFSHPDFHPNCPRLDLWFVQSVNLAGLNEGGELASHVSYTHDILPAQREIEVTLPLLEACESALGDHLRDPSAVPIYGIVFRGQCGAFSDLLHESTLMTALRRLIYNMPKSQWLPKTPSKRISYAILRAALTQDRWTFLNLFPQYSEEIKRVDTAIGRMSHRIVSNLQRGVNIEASTALEQATSQIQAKISHNRGIDFTQGDAPAIVEDFIRDGNNLGILFKGLIAV